MLAEQKEKIEAWYNSNSERLFIISGFAGCGKTTLARKIPQVLKINNYAFLAPTGIAAKVLGEDAQTIHSFLYHTKKDESTGELIFTKKNIFDFDQKLLIIDEISMVNEELLRDLKRLKIKIVGIGDPQQLPPVHGTNEILANPDIFLSKVWRNDRGLLQLATDVRNGIMDKTNYENVEFRRSILFDLGLYDDESIIICRRNKTRRALNKRIREKIYSYKRVLELGERIMILRNRRESGLRNGSIVTIKAIHEVDFRSSIASITVEEVNGEKIRLDVFLHTILGEELPKITQDQKNIVDIDYAYAITCHKSQGSEFKKVFVIREDSHFEDWDKWYYTAVTRAREKLYIY